MKLPTLPKTIIKTALGAAVGIALVNSPSALAQNQPAKPDTAPREDKAKGLDQQNTGQRGYGQSQASTEVTKFIQGAAKGSYMEVKMGRLALEKAQSPAIKQYAQTIINDHTKANQQLVPLALKKGVMLPTEVQQQVSEAASVASAAGEKKTGPTLDRQPVRDSVNEQKGLQDPTRAKTTEDERRLTRDQPRKNADGTEDAHADKHDGAMALQKLEGLSGTQFDQAYIDHMVMDHEKCITKFEEAVRTISDPEVKAFASATLPTLRQHLQQARGLKTAIPSAPKE